MLFVEDKNYLEVFEKKTEDLDFIEGYIKLPADEVTIKVKMALRQIFYDFWFRCDDEIESKILSRVNENNVWMIIDFFRDKITKHFEDTKNGLECARLSTLMEKFYKKAFEFCKQGRIDMEEFENLSSSFRNQFTLKIFLQALLSEIKKEDDGSLVDKFNLYFGAFFNYLKDGFREDPNLLAIFKTNFIDQLLLDYQYAKKFDSIRYSFFIGNSNEEGSTNRKAKKRESNGNGNILSKREVFIEQLTQVFRHLYNLVKEDNAFSELQRFLTETFLNKYKVDITKEKVENRESNNSTTGSSEDKKNKKKLGKKTNRNRPSEESNTNNETETESENKFLQKKRGRPKKSDNSNTNTNSNVKKVKSNKKVESEDESDEISNNDDDDEDSNNNINKFTTKRERRKISKTDEELVDSIANKKRKNRISLSKKDKVNSKNSNKKEKEKVDKNKSKGNNRNKPSPTTSPKKSGNTGKSNLIPSTTPRIKAEDVQISKKPIRKGGKRVLEEVKDTVTPVKSPRFTRNSLTPTPTPTPAGTGIKSKARNNSNTKSSPKINTPLDADKKRQNINITPNKLNNSSNITPVKEKSPSSNRSNSNFTLRGIEESSVISSKSNSSRKNSNLSSPSASLKKIQAPSNTNIKGLRSRSNSGNRGRKAANGNSSSADSSEVSFSKRLERMKRESNTKSPSKFNITPIKPKDPSARSSKSPRGIEENIEDATITSPVGRKIGITKASAKSSAKGSKRNSSNKKVDSNILLGNKRIRFNNKESVTEFDPNTPVKTIKRSPRKATNSDSKKGAKATATKPILNRRSPVKPTTVVINRKSKRIIQKNRI